MIFPDFSDNSRQKQFFVNFWSFLAILRCITFMEDSNIGLFLKGGVFSGKFSEKTQNAAAPAAGFSSLCLQRKHFWKGRVSYVVLRHDSVTLAYPYIFLSFIMVYIHKMCKNIFAPRIVLFTGQKYIAGVWGRSPQRKNGVYQLSLMVEGRVDHEYGKK